MADPSGVISLLVVPLRSPEKIKITVTMEDCGAITISQAMGK